MSTLAIAPQLFADLGGEPTLDELLTGVWEGLAAHHPQLCPLCGGELRPPRAGHAGPVAGRCSSCQTTIT